MSIQILLGKLMYAGFYMHAVSTTSTTCEAYATLIDHGQSWEPCDSVQLLEK